MGKDERELYREYGDLLGADADPDLLRLVTDLDAISDTAQPPASVAAAREQALRERVRQARPTHRWVGPRWLPRRLGTVAASVLAALLLAGGVYALISVLDRAFDLNIGTQRIVNEGLGRQLNLAQTVDGYTLTIGRAYADANQAVIGYTLRGPSDGSFTNLTLSGSVPPGLTDTTGTEFEPVIGTGTGVLEPETSGGLLTFDASSVAGAPRELDLRLEIQGLEAVDATGKSEVINGPFSFSFSVPFVPGRAVELHQIVESGGTRVTLERVVITPTGARADLRGVGPNADVELRVDGENHSLKPPGTVPLLWEAGSVWSYFTPAPLMEKLGEWELIVRPGPPPPPDIQPAPPKVEGGPWEFRFVIR